MLNSLFESQRYMVLTASDHSPGGWRSPGDARYRPRDLGVLRAARPNGRSALGEV
jgi:hypothetical protein